MSQSPQRAGPLAKLEKGAVGSKWSKKWVVVDSRSVAYFATDKPPKPGEAPRKKFELGDLTLRTQPSEVSAQAGKKANVAFQLLERSSKYLITFACATPQEVRARARAARAAAAPASERQPPRAHRAPTARARAHALRAAAAAAAARAQLGEWVQFLNTVMAQHARARPENGGGSAAPATAAGGGAAPGFAGGAAADPEVVASIRDILPHLSRERVAHALEAHDGDFDRALEYLMADAWGRG